MYSLQDYVMKFVSGFLWVLRLTSTNKTDRHDITKILLKVVLITIIHLFHQSLGHIVNTRLIWEGNSEQIYCIDQ